MKQARGILIVAFLAILMAATVVSTAHAVIVTPGDFGGPYCLSPVFGAASCGITTQYSAGGLVFDGLAAVFDDPPHAWGGIDSSGLVSLVAPVHAFFVVPSDTIDATTDSISVEIGLATVGSLLLEAFDYSGTLIGASLNDDGIGPNGRTLATVTIPGIHSFTVSGSDTWGIDQIEFGSLTGTVEAGTTVPEPTTVLLLGSGLGGLGFIRRRRR